MKQALLFKIGIVCAIVLIGAIDAMSANQQETLSFTESTSGIDRIAVSNINGDITISGGDVSEVKIEAKRYIEGDNDEVIARYAEEFYPEFHRRGGRLIIETQYPDEDKRWNKEIDEASIDYVITLPAGFGVDLETINGDVTVSEVTGRVLTETINGEITVESMSGINGEIEAESVNGEIQIAVRGLTGDSDFETVNGEIEIAVSEQLDAEIGIETVNGEVLVSVPESAKFSLRASVGLNGSIETDWGEPREDGEDWSFGEDFDTDVNGGGELISIETLNGEIEVRKVKS